MTSLIDQAIALHRQGRLRKAIELYKQALTQKSTPPLEHFLGMAYFGLRHYRLAATHLQSAAEAEPKRVDFLTGYGNVLHEQKDYKAAIAVFQRAIALSPDNLLLWFNLGNAALAAREAELAIEAFEHVLAVDPLFVQALANLGAVLVAGNQFDKFCQLLDRTYALRIWNNCFGDIALLGIPRAAGSEETEHPLIDFLQGLASKHPKDARLPWLLGHYHFMRQEFRTARDYYEQSIALDGTATAPKRVLAILLAADEETERALAYLQDCKGDDEQGEQALKLAKLYIGLSDKSPEDVRIYGLLTKVYVDNIPLLTNYGSRLADKGEHAATLEVFTQLAQLEEKPNYLISMAGALTNLSRNGEASRYLRRALEIEPENFAGLYNMCLVSDKLGQSVEAFSYALRAVKVNPRHIESAGMAASFAGRLHQYEESERILAVGLKHNPKSVDLLSLMGNTLMRRGNMTDAVKYYARARRNVQDSNKTAAANYAIQLMNANYTPDIPPAVTADMHFKWGDALMEIMAHSQCNVPPPTALKPRLRIGYMSGDYKSHSCSHFMLPVVTHHHADKVDVFCYMTERANDEITMQFRQQAPHWRSIVHMSDADIIKVIQEDEIDILVDLSGHTSGARMGVFACKPAPIQINWLGYPNTTGLPTIDYRFTDAYADPPGMTEKYHRETLYRLPHFLCYAPRPLTPPVSPLPARASGRITFGCFNNSNKITDQVVAAWAAILKQVEGSRIFLKTGSMSDGQTLQAFRAKFEKNGIEPERVECFVSFPNTFDHLMTYSEIDLTLDPFPYNGTTTSFEALWMGVPMITLAGAVHASRVGSSIMHGIGAPELVADTVESYVAKAVSLAHDLDRIEAYRAGLREQLRLSPLMDAETFVMSLETAYFDMWARAVADNSSNKMKNSRKDYAL